MRKSTHMDKIIHIIKPIKHSLFLMAFCPWLSAPNTRCTPIQAGVLLWSGRKFYMIFCTLLDSIDKSWNAFWFGIVYA